MPGRPHSRRARRGPTSATSPSLRRRDAIALVALAATGVVASLYLTYVHYRIGLDPAWESICAISPALSCDAVVSSPYGTLFGAPLSAYAAWFYAFTAALALAGRRPRRRLPRSPAVLLLLAGAFALTLSIPLALVSAVWIGSLCLFCAALYFVNLGLFLVSWRAVRETGESLAQAFSAELLNARRHRALVAVLVGGNLALIAMIPRAYSHPSSKRSMLCELLADPAFAPPVTLVIYNDFQCPHCRTLDRSLRPLRGRSGLRIVPRHYPLDSECNPQVKRSRHVGACLQARAAICAAGQGRYDDFSDHLFDGGPADAAGLMELAMSLGFDRSSFETCFWSENTREQLAADLRAGDSDDVRGTPTVLVNGQRHAGQLDSTDFACLAKLPQS